MTTSISEILIVSAAVLGATLLGTATRSTSGDVRRLKKAVGGSFATEVDDERAQFAVRSNHRSLQGIFIALMPAVAMVVTMTTCSLLRDRGVVIFWVPILVVCSFPAFVAWWSSRIRERLILRAFWAIEN